MSIDGRPLRVLIVENSPDDAELIIDHLEQFGFAVSSERVETAEDMTRALREGKWDVILSDFLMPAFTGLDALELAKEFELGIPFIIVSGSIGEDLAVQAMRTGANDYLMKDRMARLGAAVERELEDSRIRRERKGMEQDLRQHAEELRVKADLLAKANLELERFAYLAAHDLQEPLRMVAAYAELLVKRYREKLDPDVDRIVGFIQTGIDRMETLIHGLLTYSETLHEAPPALCPTALERIVEQAIENKKDKIATEGATVTHSGLPTVMADSGKLRFVFEQLITNSLKFSKPDVTPKIDIQAEVKDDEVLVSFADNGIGIDSQYWDQIFGLFKRLHRTDESGLGMGLALCRRIIEQHGGRIWLESSVGDGATFFFTLKPPLPEQH